jgi:hypothetical protein
VVAIDVRRTYRAQNALASHAGAEGGNMIALCARVVRSAVVVGALGVGTLLTSAGATPASPTAVTGTYHLEYCWAGSPCNTASVVLSPDHTFQTSELSSGVWSDRNHHVELSFDAGCEPLYRGVRTARGARGEIHCRVGSENHGTFTLTRA